MVFVTIEAHTIELIIFWTMTALAAGVIWLYFSSRKLWREVLPPKENKTIKDPFLELDREMSFDYLYYSDKPIPEQEKKVTSLKQRLQNFIGKKEPFSDDMPSQPVFKKREAPKSDVIESLKVTISQQQKTFKDFLADIEDMQGEENRQLEKEKKALQKTISRLEDELAQKNTALQNAKQEAATAQKMAARIDEAYKEFDWLQTKITDLEQQSKRATELSIKLEDIQQSYEQQKKDIARKQEKLEQVIAENQRLHYQLSEVEDKLTEANLQRQQLTKKTQLLQDMNEDIHSLTDTNKKLQTELRRIGELESMLSMIQEERTQLQKKQSR